MPWFRGPMTRKLEPCHTFTGSDQAPGSSLMSAAFLVSEQNRYHLLPASELSCAKNTATSMLRPLGPRNR